MQHLRSGRKNSSGAAEGGGLVSVLSLLSLLSLFSTATIASTLLACGGSAAGTPDAASFAGTWTCSVSTTQTITAPASSTNTTSSTTDEVFVANPDGTLTGTFGNADAGASDCSLDYSISDSTATAAAGQSCSWFLKGFALSSSSFVVSGDHADMTMNVTVTDATGTGPDGGPATVSGVLGISGTCTKS